MEESTEEISNAIKRIKVGIPGRVDDLVMAIGENDKFSVALETSLITLENINKKRILDELSYCKNKFNQLIELSDDLKKLTLNRKINFMIDYNYGMGYTQICRMIDDKIEWLIDVDR
jgi:hypothetical protein